jgi:hypothetical protein
LPKTNKFKLHPNLGFLSRMTENELKKVRNFSIENEFGKIYYENEEVNLFDAKIDEIFEIKKNYFEYYPGQILKPKNNNFNKPVQITFYKLFNVNKKELELKLKQFKGKFISYDKENGKFVFKLDKFLF